MSLLGDKLKTKNSTLGKKLNPNKTYSEQTLRVINSMAKEKTNNSSTTQQKMDNLWEENQTTKHGGAGRSFADNSEIIQQQNPKTLTIAGKEYKVADSALPNQVMLTDEQRKEIEKQAPLSIDKIRSNIGKIKNTAEHIIGSGVTGAMQGAEGLVQEVIGTGGNFLEKINRDYIPEIDTKNITKENSKRMINQLVYGKPTETSEKIKKTTEELVGLNVVDEAKERLDKQTNELYGKHNPEVLGVPVSNIASEAARMVTLAPTGLPGFMASAAGGNISEAINEGEELDNAVRYGAVSGAIEGGTEKMFDTFNILGGGVIDKFLPKRAMGKFITGSLGEGVEEIVTEAANPFVKMATYEGEVDNPVSSSEAFDNYVDRIKDAGWQGFVMGMFMQGAHDISDAEVREQYKSEVSNAVEKVKGLTENQKKQMIDKLVNASITSSMQLSEIENYMNQYKNTSEYSKYIPTKQNFANNITINDTKSSQLDKLIPTQKNDALQSTQNEPNNTANQIIPAEGKTAQNGNMEQITQGDKVMDVLLGKKAEKTQNPVQIKAEETLTSAKQAGMTDIDINKATELNNLLQSNAKLQFYDENNLPQGFSEEDMKKVKVANGLYSNGTIYINKNSKNVVEKILGHELTHHLETTGSFNDLSNTILDSDVFYEYMTEKGFQNVQAFKQNLLENGYNEQQLDNEIVARFVEDNLFSNQDRINRIARKNTTLAEKIKNFISDLKVKLKGTAQEKQLLKIEDMYRKALEQARNNSYFSSDTQYSVGGVVGAKNIQKNPEYRDIMKDYDTAVDMLNNGAKNSETIRETGWYKDTDGNIKYEFTDEDMSLKDSYKFDDNKIYPLDRILKHDILFEAYPQLRDYTVVSMNLGKDYKAAIFGPAKIIMLNNTKLKTREQVEYSLIHEIQHAIQNIEGFPGSRTNINGKYAYYTSLGEIESRDTSNRLRMLAEERRVNLPESAKENPTHPGLENYLQKRTQKDIEKDNKYLAKKEKRDALKESVKKFLEGRIGFEEDNITDIYETTSENGELSSRTDGRGRVAGKGPAFSLPENDNQGHKLSKEQQEFFRDSKIRDDKGRLIEVYHRTNQDFTEFDRNKIGSATDDGLWGSGFYFSNRDHDFYGKNVIKGYLNITNPLVMRDFKSIKEIADYLDIVERNFFYEPDGLIRVSYNQIGQFTSHVIDKGHDGVVADHGNGVYEYVIFEPNQIKNVDNTNPTENADIRYSMDPVEVAKNPPNIETGLDQLQRTKRIKEGDTQSSFAKNVLNQNIFDDKFKDLALDDKNIRSYDRITNKETLQKANDAINEQGQKWVERFLDKSNGDMKATDIAGGFILMNRYQQVGDYESMIRVAEKLRKAGTQQGQTIQMFSVLGRMTPEGMTYYAQKTLSEAYDEILKNKTQAWANEHADDFKLNEKDIEFIQRRVKQASRLPEGRDKYVLLGEIAARIQNKIPPEPGQSMKSLARISMLLNSKTMIRNILGNIVIVPNHIVSDFIGTAIDKNISKKTGVRTTGTFTMQALTGIKKGVYESFDDFRRGISTREIAGDRFEIGQGKSFNENHTGKFSAQRNKLNKALNGLDRVTGFLLETGDRPIYETWFINSLNNQMKLNNVTEPTAKMIEIATDEALQRTWQDNNTYTKAVNSVRKALNNFNIKGYGLGDMVMPFVKTPANLTKAVVDFSPLGAINAALKTTQFNKDIEKGTATSKQQREVVKAWAQVITGSLGMAIMTALANAGILSGGSDEDKDVRSFEQNVLGIKPYSIKIGDKTFTYDWAQPLGTTAAMVTDTVNSLKNAKDTESKATAILNGLQSGASVLLDQSFVSGIRNLFEEDNLINALIETGFNEGTKFTPQFLSQIAQLQDDTARTSYVYNNMPQTAVNKIKAKIPGLRQTLEPSVDVLGREVKTDNSIFNILLNPTNTGKANTTKEAQEMYNVYKETGDKATIAPVAPYYITVDKEKIILSPKQRTEYQKTTGQIALDSIDNLLKNNSYNKSKPEEKAEILKEVYSYANAVAKSEVSDYELSTLYQDIQNSGADVSDVLLAREIANTGGTSRDDQTKALVGSGYSKTQATKFLDWLNKTANATKKVDGEKVRKNNYLKNVF